MKKSDIYECGNPNLMMCTILGKDIFQLDTPRSPQTRRHFEGFVAKKYKKVRNRKKKRQLNVTLKKRQLHTGRPVVFPVTLLDVITRNKQPGEKLIKTIPMNVNGGIHG